eukprot:1052120-Alexandrium_andersonii.AAC.1
MPGCWRQSGRPFGLQKMIFYIHVRNALSCAFAHVACELLKIRTASGLALRSLTGPMMGPIAPAGPLT